MTVHAFLIEFFQMSNPNSLLDPQNDIHALAHMSPEEVAEANMWFDGRDAEDSFLDAAYEERTEMDFGE